ncbi:hypothetical protein FOL47_007580 [Perkinsus chesapeaki]|uniref:Peptidase A1 domain-containing protein n=1 Tax=Perkinsus chesapeaki TaxID=330153 RepID=A0A7J6LJJ4_PERCH|nr:hypothetical protein FOL47_007580 [Perkinsus chesapeaki]
MRHVILPELHATPEGGPASDRRIYKATFADTSVLYYRVVTVPVLILGGTQLHDIKIGLVSRCVAPKTSPAFRPRGMLGTSITEKFKSVRPFMKQMRDSGKISHTSLTLQIRRLAPLLPVIKGIVSFGDQGSLELTAHGSYELPISCCHQLAKSRVTTQASFASLMYDSQPIFVAKQASSSDLSRSYLTYIDSGCWQIIVPGGNEIVDNILEVAGQQMDKAGMAVASMISREDGEIRLTRQSAEFLPTLKLVLGEQGEVPVYIEPEHYLFCYQPHDCSIMIRDEMVPGRGILGIPFMLAYDISVNFDTEKISMKQKLPS